MSSPAQAWTSERDKGNNRPLLGWRKSCPEIFQEAPTQQGWPVSTAQAGLHRELLTVREHRDQAPGIWIIFCFIQKQGERSKLHLRAMTGVQREMSPFHCNSAHEATANAACSRHARLTLNRSTEACVVAEAHIPPFPLYSNFVYV